MRNAVDQKQKRDNDELKAASSQMHFKEHVNYRCYLVLATNNIVSPTLDW